MHIQFMCPVTAEKVMSVVLHILIHGMYDAFTGEHSVPSSRELRMELILDPRIHGINGCGLASPARNCS